MALTIARGYTASSGEVWTPTKQNLSTVPVITVASGTLVGRSALGVGSIEEIVLGDGFAIFAGSISLGWLDTNASHRMRFACGSDLTADRTITFIPGDAPRTLTLAGDASLDQDVSTTGTPTFVGINASSRVFINTTERTALWVNVAGNDQYGEGAVRIANTSPPAADTSANLTLGNGAPVTNMALNNRMGGVVFFGMRDNAGFFLPYNSAAIFAYANETWGPAAGGSRLEFSATPNGSTTRTTIATVTGTGLAVTGLVSAFSAFPFGNTNGIGVALNRFAVGTDAWGVDMRRWTGAGSDHHVAYVGQFSDTGAVYPIGFFYDNNKTTNTQATTLRAKIDQNGLTVIGSITATTGVFRAPNGVSARLVSADNTNAVISVDGGSQVVVPGYAPVTIANGIFTTTNITVSGLGVVLTLVGNTNATYQKFATNGGNFYIGVSSDAGAGLLPGVGNYGYAIVAESNRNVGIGVNNTLVGLFTATGLAVTGTITASAGITSSFNNAITQGINLRETTDTAFALFAVFRRADNVDIGTIQRVNTTNAVVYNTASDARLKKNLRDFTGADSGKIIDRLRPRWFDWKNATDDSGKNAIGFVAQEEHEADPALARIGAVTVGDADPDTIGQPWQRSDAALVPIIVAEIKALRARLQLIEAAA